MALLLCGALRRPSDISALTMPRGAHHALPISRLDSDTKEDAAATRRPRIRGSLLAVQQALIAISS
jgi:hypothetical protein